MAKYRNAYRDDDEDTLTYAEELEQERNSFASKQEPPEPDDAAAPDSEEATFKKRYGDLRRHMQQKEQEYNDRLAKMQAQLDAATKEQIKFPKTDEEIEAWSKKYPEVAKIVDTIARKRASEALEEGEKRMKQLQEKQEQLSRKEAEQQLLEMHPDFGEIRQSQEFHDWVAEQPMYIQDALYRNATDAKAAGRAIDLYKADTGKGRKRTKQQRAQQEAAAEDTGRSTRTSPPEGDKKQFRESEVDRMSEAEFEKNEAAILEAMKTGNFIYDLSGSR